MAKAHLGHNVSDVTKTILKLTHIYIVDAHRQYGIYFKFHLGKLKQEVTLCAVINVLEFVWRPKHFVGPYNWMQCVKQLEVSALAALQLVTIHFLPLRPSRDNWLHCTNLNTAPFKQDHQCLRTSQNLS